MNKIILSLSLILMSLFSFAQNEQYHNAMKGHLMKLDNASSPESYIAIANGFERIANNETKEWLPRYYAAFCYAMQAFATEDKSNIDPILDKADKLIKEADALSPNNDEIICLQSLSTSARIGVSPMTRGMKYGGEASALLKKAKEINAHNPRIYYLEGQSKFHTPAMFGGGKDKAKALYEKAIIEFANFKPLHDLMPNWGANQAAKMLKECDK